MKIAVVLALASVLALPAFAQVYYDCTGQPDGTPCDDGNSCTTADTCYQEYCMGGPPLDCDDGDPCTIDTCGSFGGCSHRSDPYCTSNRPPDCRRAAASSGELWPPKHQLVPESVIGVVDPDGDHVTITITRIAQDEPVDGGGVASTCPDGEGVGPNKALLRAERNENGDGRVYDIAFTANDGNGGQCTSAVRVCVPLRLGGSCGDDGVAFNAMGTCLAE